MNGRVNRNVAALPFSGIRRFFDMARQTKDVISLGVGEPDFFTPWNVREAAIYQIEHTRAVYSANAGFDALRLEIARYLRELIGVEYAPAQILATVGASEGLDVALRAVVEAGDEVIIHEPCFVAYNACATLAGGVVKVVETREEDAFKLTPDAFEAAITPKTKVLLISFPNNPTGAVMTLDELKPIAELCVKNDIIVVSDEIYAELTFGGKHASIASLPGMKERTVVINGFSKAFAMTGWRLGYAAAPPDIMEQMLKIHQYVIMCAPTPAQHAGIEALRHGAESVIKMRESFDQRRRVVVKGFNDIGLKTFEPKGAFYAFPSVKAFGLTSDAFCERLLKEGGVAIVPGTAFGACGEGFCRVCYAYSIEQLEAAVERIGAFVAKL